MLVHTFTVSFHFGHIFPTNDYDRRMVWPTLRKKSHHINITGTIARAQCLQPLLQAHGLPSDAFGWWLTTTVLVDRGHSHSLVLLQTGNQRPHRRMGMTNEAAETVIPAFALVVRAMTLTQCPYLCVCLP